MNVRADAIRVAIFAVVGLFMAALVLIAVGRWQIGVAERSYSAVFRDVSALEQGDLVRVAGVRVGQVSRVSIRPDGLLTVDFDVADDQPVLTTTRALIRYQDLIGHRYLELAPGPDDEGANSAPLATGGILPLSQTVPALDLNVLLGGFKPLFQGLQPQQINELATDIVNTLQGRDGTVENLLAHTASLTSTVADRDSVIAQLVSNLNSVLDTLDSRDQQLSDMVTQLQRLVSGLSADRNDIGDSLTQINDFTGDLTSLLHEARPPLRNTIDQLHRTADHLDANRDTLEDALRDISTAYERLPRAGSYGSFFNLYLCSVQVKTTGPDGRDVFSPVIRSNNSTPRCHGQ